MDPAPTLAIPVGWRLRGALDRGVLLSAVSPETGPTGRAPAIRLEVEPVRVPIEAWVGQEINELRHRLGDVVVEGESWGGRAGLETSYRRLRHPLAGVVTVTERWRWLVDGLGFTLTASVAAEDHEAYAGLLAAVAGSFSVGARRSSSAPCPAVSR